MTTWDDWLAAEEPSADEAILATAPEVDQPRGWTDSTRSVTVWCDDAARITRIRVSTAWRDRGDDRLDARVREAVGASQLLRLGPAGLAGPDVLSVDDVELGGLHPKALWQLGFVDPAQVAELARRTVAMVASSELQPETEPEAAAVTASSTNRRVTVTLGPDAAITDLVIDPEWAAASRAERIGDVVMEALTSAYAVWQAPEPAPGASRQRVEEAVALRRQALALVGAGRASGGES